MYISQIAGIKKASLRGLAQSLLNLVTKWEINMMPVQTAI